VAACLPSVATRAIAADGRRLVAAKLAAAVLLFLAIAAAPAAAHDEPPQGMRIEGVASFYGVRHHGRMKANGAPFDMMSATVAHRDLPLGTEIQIRNLANGRTARAVVTDRGPYVDGRALDVSLGVARRLDMQQSGLARVEIRVLDVARPGVAAFHEAPGLRGHRPPGEGQLAPASSGAHRVASARPVHARPTAASAATRHRHAAMPPALHGG
jgi:rare lipoprotein A